MVAISAVRAYPRHLALVSLLVAAGCGPGEDEPTEDQDEAAFAEEEDADAAGRGQCSPLVIDDRSLILNDLPALAARNFNLRRVLSTLAAQTADPGDTAESLYANMASTLVRGFGSSTRVDDWYGVALINRFDLAPQDASTCGEYRLIVSRPRRFMENDRFTVIFEASMPNPRPDRGLQGCRPLQNVWARLSAEPDPVARAASLEAMYFSGIARFPPVVSIDNYGARGLGQVRANFFLGADLGPWILDEFALQFTPQTSDAARPHPWGVTFVDRPVANVLGVNIFEAGPATTGQVARLRQSFLAQLGSMAASDPARIRFTVAEPFRASVSGASVGSSAEGIVSGFIASGGDSSRFGQEIAAAMTARRIRGITPTQMVRRAFTQSCGGCHDDARADIGGGATWPKNQPDGRVFIIDPNGGMSGALVAFLPARRANLQRFLSCGRL